MSINVEESSDGLTFSYGASPLMTYVRKPSGPSLIATAQYPYIHPLVTLGGNIVTEIKPATHPYLHGLFLSAQNVSETNFWGPATYLPIVGYVMRDDRGEIHSQKYQVHEDLGASGISEQLKWVSKTGVVLLEEDRSIEVQRVDEDESAWVLNFTYKLNNVTEDWIYFATPGSDGRKDSTGRPGWGYSGLFWRGPMSMQNGLLFGPEATGEQQLDGESTAWLGFVGNVGDGAKATLVFVNDRENHTSWYANSSEYPGVGFGIAARQRRYLEPSATLTRAHQIVVADGAWDRDRIREYVARL